MLTFLSFLLPLLLFSVYLPKTFNFWRTASMFIADLMTPNASACLHIHIVIITPSGMNKSVLTSPGSSSYPSVCRCPQMSFVVGFLLPNWIQDPKVIHDRLLTHPADEKERLKVLIRRERFHLKSGILDRRIFLDPLGLQSNSWEWVQERHWSVSCLFQSKPETSSNGACLWGRVLPNLQRVWKKTGSDLLPSYQKLCTYQL